MVRGVSGTPGILLGLIPSLQTAGAASQETRVATRGIFATFS